MKQKESGQRLEKRVRFTELEFNRDGRIITRSGHKIVKAKRAGRESFRVDIQNRSCCYHPLSYEERFVYGERSSLLNMLKPNNAVNAYTIVNWTNWVSWRVWDSYGRKLETITHEITLQYYRQEK